MGAAGAPSAAQGKRNRADTAGVGRNAHRNPVLGTAFVHTVLDDHSRVAYAEIHDDETAATAAGVLRRAVARFAARGVIVQRMLSDNGSAYRSHTWRDTCAELGIRPKRTRPYRPQTNGKIERFHRTLADGWPFARVFGGESARRKALPAWLRGSGSRSVTRAGRERRQLTCRLRFRDGPAGPHVPGVPRRSRARVWRTRRPSSRP
jgi:transposase InsO family protein